MAQLFNLGIVLLYFLPLLMHARGQFDPYWILQQNQAIQNQAAAQSQAIFNMANSAIARGFASGASSMSGVYSSSDGTGSTVTFLGSNGDGIYRVTSFNKKK